MTGIRNVHVSQVSPLRIRSVMKWATFDRATVVRGVVVSAILICARNWAHVIRSNCAGLTAWLVNPPVLGCIGCDQAVRNRSDSGPIRGRAALPAILRPSNPQTALYSESSVSSPPVIEFRAS